MCAAMKNKKLYIFLALALIVLIGNYFFEFSNLILEPLKHMEQLANQNIALMVLLYIVLTIVGCVLLALPGVTFAIAAGILFGPFLGTVCCSVATTIGAMLSFLVGRYFLKDSIEPVAKKNRYLNKWLFDESGHNEIFVLMITRLVPLFPYNLQNLAYGITDIHFFTYSFYSFLFMLPGTAMYTIGTAGLVSGEKRTLYISIAIVLALLVTGGGMLLKKHYFSEDKNNDK